MPEASRAQQVDLSDAYVVYCTCVYDVYAIYDVMTNAVYNVSRADVRLLYCAALSAPKEMSRLMMVVVVVVRHHRCVVYFILYYYPLRLSVRLGYTRICH